MQRLFCAIALSLVVPFAHGFELVIKGNHAVIPDAELRQMTLEVAQASGHRIPDTPNIKVVVTARARLRKNSGMYLYYHRVQLTKAFAGGPPYPVRAWLPIKSLEKYGVAQGAQLRQMLRTNLTTFFTDLKHVDPQTQAP